MGKPLDLIICAVKKQAHPYISKKNPILLKSRRYTVRLTKFPYKLCTCYIPSKGGDVFLGASRNETIPVIFRLSAQEDQ